MGHEPLQDNAWDPTDAARATRAPAAFFVSIIVMAAGTFFLADLAKQSRNHAVSASQPINHAETATVSTNAPENTVNLMTVALSKETVTTPVKTSVGKTLPVFGNAPSVKPTLAASTNAAAISPTKPSDYFGPSLNPRRAAEKSTTTVKTAFTEPRGFWPSLKPTNIVSNSAPAKILTAKPKRPMTFGGFAIAAEGSNPPPVFFGSDVSPIVATSRPLAVAMSADLETEPTEVTVKLSKGETFVDALKRAGIRAQDRNAAASAFGKVQNLRYLRPGQEFLLVTAAPNQTVYQLASAGDSSAHLLSLDFRVDAQNKIGVKRLPEGNFDAVKHEIPLTTRIASVKGRIEGSLFVSAKKAGAPNQVIANLANMFAYDVDFQRDIFGGDEFEAIFEVLYDNEGRIVGGGDILYGRLKWRGRSKEKGYYRFASADGGAKADYFDRAGQSAKRLLMKTPIDGARLSSGFGTRRHPILGYRKAHKGVDFAARRGTPIYAAGDGVIERANRYGSFGNYIRIRHSNGYKTAYAHLKGFRKGIRKGKRVDQGDVIGYVGTTGRSTGPHLHYEVHRNGKAVNPQKLKIATGTQLKGRELDRFKKIRNDIEYMRNPPKQGARLLAEDKAEKGKQL